ncbi:MULTISPECIES: glycosyltransferase family 2 protein [unclassified Brevundimonas]|uniref:glycosyltransferase family 2 protein n=1 Tax=unclassified Brevundimonas TaxID=2622653 RepID=UPI000CFB5973|nr:MULTISPECIES: glycosyltransferase family 2 protein [unclassified Brevundimonas]PRA34437.1 family 2 glycosyl transferase [Brevundimonas sp. MYb27]PQZ84137.1 family 2 glycosyl transferase [Brevundimonas sp. MYb31]PRB17890.1 family 2 glycosyl transferase [Brevundimonas sp. MYb52]PRB38261.1 family 2 glycosyl transferase [Brevundimonas sp. MYb46]PRB55958.1 family 2 glycosyl transferase [Brevundimonas sp. MYb33]
MSAQADVTVIIPTLRRPDSLERAMRSVLAQVGVVDRLREIIVVDNDPEASSRELTTRLAAEASLPVVWRHAPRPGVATARNEGLAATTAPLIAFLDDDEAASTGWLAALLSAQEATGADAVFGPIRGRVPDETGWTTPYLERFFGREGPPDSRLIDIPYGCGNSLLVRATALPGAAPFNLAADQSGGEDDALFAALAGRGGRFGWAADAWVDEFAPPHRATLRYALTRAFAYGQGPSQTAAAARDWPRVARWMVIGAAQAGVWLFAAAGLTLIASPRRADMLDRSARGLGKLFWMKGFEPHFYGARELDRLNRQPA